MIDNDDEFDMNKLYPQTVKDQIEEEGKTQTEEGLEETELEITVTLEPSELTFDPPLTAADKELQRLDNEAEIAQRELEEAERALKYTLDGSEIGQDELESGNLKDIFDKGREE
ncbi:hypothetical protein [uncultured Roseobacter sp.]|uniref:hypothetical protein n=1 Tax=uncultured Roseobacter sp. TaxID=114847 RepID=UPI0026255988|nr:hypothetical protein [uncultured Roseobacter sp.]